MSALKPGNRILADAANALFFLVALCWPYPGLGVPCMMAKVIKL